MKCRAIILAINVLLSLGTMVSGQTNRMPLSKADQTAASVDMLYNIKQVVLRDYVGKELTMYKAISNRLTMCGLLYGLLSNAPGERDKAFITSVGKVYINAGAFLHYDTFEFFEKDFDQIRLRFEKAKADKKQMFYLARNCKAFTETQSVANAVEELSLD
jgi:hypothetical protein